MTSKAVGNRRLAKLATYLEETKFKKGKFHLGTWMAGYNGMTQSCAPEDTEAHAALADLLAKNPSGATFQLLGDGIMPVDCKTAGCAVGWGIAGIPSFRKAGMSFVYADINDTDYTSRAGIQYYDKKTDTVYRDMSAPAKFFGLSETTKVDDHAFHGSHLVTCLLFVQEYYPMKQRSNPKAVAKRIRVYLKGGDTALLKTAKRAMKKPGEVSRLPSIF